MENKTRIVLTGGGTAGHITPNIALIPFLNEFELHYIGQPDSMEQELISKFPQVTFHAVESVKLKRSFSLDNLAIPIKLLKTKKKAGEILDEIKPKVIFSKGGFVSLPVALACKDIPLILHESDYSMGLANKLVVKKCKYACTSFSHLAQSLPNGVVTGAPLRQSLYLGSKTRCEKECGLKGRKNLLIFGGSLGAGAINNVVFKAVDELTKNYDVVHIIGKNNKTDIKTAHYFPLNFTSEIADYFAWADFVVTRGGANALFELAALKKPSLVIPLPKGASRGDQLDNAEYFEKLGCFNVLKQEFLDEKTLATALRNLENDKKRLKENLEKNQSFDGTAKIVQLIKDCAR